MFPRRAPVATDSPHLRFGSAALAQSSDVSLEPITGLQLNNVKAEGVTYKGRRAVRITDTAPENEPD